MTGSTLLPARADAVEIPFSILDTDLYKVKDHQSQQADLASSPCRMQSFVTFPTPRWSYASRIGLLRCSSVGNALNGFAKQSSVSSPQDDSDIAGLETLRLTDDERQALSKACPYFPESYLDFLASIQLKPRQQVGVTFEPQEGEDMGLISCRIEGLWRECILYEVPIMSICKCFRYSGAFG